MRKRMMMILMGASLFLTAEQALLAQPAGGKQMQMQKGKKGTPPFLIMGKMPHYTKLLMQKWDDPKLALTDEQKKALEKVRKETMSAVLEIKPQLAKLEQEIADKILHGATPDSLKADVEKVAKLKTKATMAHLKCIYDTQKVLTESQLKYLFN